MLLELNCKISDLMKKQSPKAKRTESVSHEDCEIIKAYSVLFLVYKQNLHIVFLQCNVFTKCYLKWLKDSLKSLKKAYNCVFGVKNTDKPKLNKLFQHNFDIH